MFNVIANRIVWACLTMAAISVVAFTLIHLPPGDFVDSIVSGMQQSGQFVTQDDAARMRSELGLEWPAETRVDYGKVASAMSEAMDSVRDVLIR